MGPKPSLSIVRLLEENLDVLTVLLKIADHSMGVRVKNTGFVVCTL